MLAHVVSGTPAGDDADRRRAKESEWSNRGSSSHSLSGSVNSLGTWRVAQKRVTGELKEKVEMERTLKVNFVRFKISERC